MEHSLDISLIHGPLEKQVIILDHCILCFLVISGPTFVNSSSKLVQASKKTKSGVNIYITCEKDSICSEGIGFYCEKCDTLYAGFVH